METDPLATRRKREALEIASNAGWRDYERAQASLRNLQSRCPHPDSERTEEFRGVYGMTPVCAACGWRIRRESDGVRTLLDATEG